jgi:hypothetical protein
VQPIVSNQASDFHQHERFRDEVPMRRSRHPQLPNSQPLP